RALPTRNPSKHLDPATCRRTRRDEPGWRTSAPAGLGAHGLCGVCRQPGGRKDRAVAGEGAAVALHQPRRRLCPPGRGPCRLRAHAPTAGGGGHPRGDSAPPNEVVIAVLAATSMVLW